MFLQHRMKTVKNTIFVIIIGAAFLFFFTNGLKAFTSEGVRRLNVENHPISLPVIELIDAEEEIFLMQDYKGKVVLVDFIFTHCAAVCSINTRKIQQLYKELQHSSMKGRAMLLTLSFDPDRDTPNALKSYAVAMKADVSAWRFATVRNKRRLKDLLDAFGIVVIPAPNGQYEHNSAVHLVNAASQLAKIYDYESTALILQHLKES